MTGLRISSSLTLGPDFVTKTCAILAQRRVGKTYTASVIAEEFVSNKIPFAAIDPTGAWWGLRAASNARTAGMPVTILGGQHGDLPLERGAGRLVADLVVDTPGFYVLDLGLFDSRAAEREFATDFGERIYRRKGQPNMDFAMHLLIDEADIFVPQRPPKGDERMLGAYEAIVRRGGLRGLGTTLISQRAAVVNKNVLEQIDMLITLRTVGPNDRAAIERYIIAKGTDELRAEMMGSLASLKKGEAWIWEPGVEPPLFQKVQIRERRTFNSSATPKAGEHRVAPRILAAVEIDALKTRMSALVERAKAEDPRQANREIVRLNREIAEYQRNLEALTDKYDRLYAEHRNQKPVEVPVEVSVITEDDRLGLKEVADQAHDLRLALDSMTARFDKIVADTRKPKALPVTPNLASSEVARQDHQRSPDTRAPTPSDIVLSKAGKKILDALAWMETMGFDESNRVQVAFLAGYTVNGHFNNTLSSLRTVDLVSYPAANMVRLTDSGRCTADFPASPGGVEELQAAVMAKLKGAQRKIMEVVLNIWPGDIDRETLAERAGYTVNGHFNNTLSSLRTLGLIEYPAKGTVKAEDLLFLESAA